MDAMTLTLGQFKAYLEQVPRIRKWEAGEDPDQKKGLDVEDFVAAVMAGDLKPKLGPDSKPKAAATMTAAEKAAEEAKVKKMLGLDKPRGESIVPMFYGKR